jgi:NOL1/NOP2/sun family putative RNA methylase
MEQHELTISELKKRLLMSYPEDVVLKIFEGYEKKRVVSLRINRLKTTPEHIDQVLDEHHIAFEKVSWYDDARIIHAHESELMKLDIFSKGEIYLQNLSSMIPALILDPKPKTDVLDMAAAPGGKTTQIAAITNNLCHLTACETHPIRAERLKFNINRLGAKNVTLLIQDARKLDPYFTFDQILLDAPCTGTGTFEMLFPQTYQTFSTKLLDHLMLTQKELLKAALRMLKPGKTMIYSTCSILPEENEKQVEMILKTGQAELIPIDESWFNQIPILPTRLPGTLLIPPNEFFEGFFVAKLKKK